VKYKPSTIEEKTNKQNGDNNTARRVARRAAKTKQISTPLGGGSLGSCVDEERSQLRELV